MIEAERLVPAGRFGAALHHRRSVGDRSLTALAMASNGRWLPDHLIAVERAAVPLQDGHVRELSALYGLPGVRWAASGLEFVLDRSTMPHLSTTSSGGVADRWRRMGDEDADRWVAARFAAVAVMIGLDLTSGPVGVDVMAEVLDRTPGATVDLIESVLRDDAALVGAMIDEMSTRTVVAQVGVLVCDTLMGSVVLTSRVAPSTASVAPACTTFDELLRGARAGLN